MKDKEFVILCAIAMVIGLMLAIFLPHPEPANEDQVVIQETIEEENNE